jgi:periplasmic mercuric ion binding protein
MRKLAVVVTLTALFGAPVHAGTQTVILSVPGMTCPACPITVKKALTRVDGVANVKVSIDPREAIVTFDDTRTSVDELAKATANAGYPSTVKN